MNKRKRIQIFGFMQDLSPFGPKSSAERERSEQAERENRRWQNRRTPVPTYCAQHEAQRERQGASSECGWHHPANCVDQR